MELTTFTNGLIWRSQLETFDLVDILVKHKNDFIIELEGDEYIEPNKIKIFDKVYNLRIFWKTVLRNDKKNIKKQSDNLIYKILFNESSEAVKELEYVLKLIKEDKRKFRL